MTEQPEKNQDHPQAGETNNESKDATHASNDLRAAALEALSRQREKDTTHPVEESEAVDAAADQEAETGGKTGAMPAAESEDFGESTNDLQQAALKAQALKAEKEREESRKQQPDQPAERDLQPFTSTMILLLKVEETGNVIRREVTGELLVGRADKATDYTPAIDMTPHGAYRLGLSRRHAVIMREGDALVVRDLNSRNGTFVNNLIVPGGSSRPITDGDELRFGNLVVNVRFSES